MPYPPRSPAWCLICKVDAGQARLAACYLQRPYTAADGRRRTRSIPVRVCRDCARELIEAYAISSGRIRGDLFERSRRPPPRQRTSRGTYASRAATADASPVAAAGRGR